MTTDETVESLFASQAVTYDDLTEWRISSSVLQPLADLAGRGPGRVVDVGAGTGIVGRALSELGWTVVGLDLVPQMLFRAKDRTRYRVLGTAEILPFADDSLVGTAFRQVFHYVDDLLAIHEAARVTRRGGWLVAADVVVMDPLDLAWWEEVKRFVQPLRRRVYTRDSHLALFKRSGWKVEAVHEAWIQRSDTWDVFHARVREPVQMERVTRLVRDAADGGVHFSITADSRGVSYAQAWQLVRARRV